MKRAQEKTTIKEEELAYYIDMLANMRVKIKKYTWKDVRRGNIRFSLVVMNIQNKALFKQVIIN